MRVHITLAYKENKNIKCMNKHVNAVNSMEFRNKIISNKIWVFALFNLFWNKNSLSIKVIAFTFWLMCVSLKKENLQNYWIKMNLIKYFELSADVYTSDHFNEKRFCCSELPQADSREDASGTPRHSSLDAHSRLTCKEVANLPASLQLPVTYSPGAVCIPLLSKEVFC